MASLLNFNKNKKQISVSQFNKLRNKILILRSSGGYGDILNMRMIFEDLKKEMPDFNFDWAVPHAYFAAAKEHPFVNKIVHSADYDETEYLAVYNCTHSCVKHEWLKGKDNDKNRADIWANAMGFQLTNHNMWMPDYSKHNQKVVEKLKEIGWDGFKKLVMFSPRSAISIKNLTYEQSLFIKNMTKDHFLFIVHSAPILDLINLKIPIITTFKLEECMACTSLVDYVITTDTGHMHCAAGYKKPTLAIFCYTNGKVICKYYDTVKVVQKHSDDNPGYCGPCNNYGACTVAPQAKLKPCLTDVTNEMIESAWKFVLKNTK
jgi:ADP-heptose:LPS heptosyltransferase